MVRRVADQAAAVSFLSLIPLRAWLAVGAAALVAFFLWHDHRGWSKAKAERAARVQLETTLAAERATAAQVQADLKLNRETSHVLQARLSAVERERRDTPLPRLRCTAARVPPAAPEGRATAGADAAPAGREPEAVAFDPSADLDEYGNDCAVTAEKLAALQEWERARAH